LQLLARGLPDKMLWVTAKALGGVFIYGSVGRLSQCRVVSELLWDVVLVP
jgi:hypothetical protein